MHMYLVGFVLIFDFICVFTSEVYDKQVFHEINVVYDEDIESENVFQLISC